MAADKNNHLNFSLVIMFILTYLQNVISALIKHNIFDSLRNPFTHYKVNKCLSMKILEYAKRHVAVLFARLWHCAICCYLPHLHSHAPTRIHTQTHHTHNHTLSIKCIVESVFLFVLHIVGQYPWIMELTRF